MARRPKVFTWSDGFHAFTVAASSRPKALAAWGIERDIFASGLAHEIDEGPDYEAAQARPGEVIERGLAVDVGNVAPRPSRKSAAASGTGGRPPSAAARRRVAALEKDLSALERQQERALNELEAEAVRLARRREQLETRHDLDRRRLEDRLAKARKALG